MMQKNTKKIAPIVCAMIVIALLGAYLSVFLYALLTEAVGQTVVYLIMGVYCLGILAAIVGVAAALRQRLREIDGGEEEDAKQF